MHYSFRSASKQSRMKVLQACPCKTTVYLAVYKKSYSVQQIRQSHVHVNADQQLLRRLGGKVESIANITP